MNIAAFDLSSTRSGACVNGAPSSFAPRPKDALLVRARSTAAFVMQATSFEHEDHPYPLPADLVVIEAIGTRMVQTAIALATVHALVLDRVTSNWVGRVVTVTPADLKRFATGKGNADKDTMLLAASKRCAEVTNNDEGDAWWLWALGAHISGTPVVEETAYRTAVVEKYREAEGG